MLKQKEDHSYLSHILTHVIYFVDPLTLSVGVGSNSMSFTLQPKTFKLVPFFLPYTLSVFFSLSKRARVFASIVVNYTALTFHLVVFEESFVKEEAFVGQFAITVISVVFESALVEVAVVWRRMLAQYHLIINELSFVLNTRRQAKNS